MKPARPALACLAWLAIACSATLLTVPSAEAACEGRFALRQTHRGLQATLERALRRDGFGAALDSRALSVALVDLTRPRELYYAGINDDDMVYAASLPKLGILLAVIDSVQNGRIAWRDDFRYQLRKMITISNNAYATWGAMLVGLKPMNAILMDPRYCFYEPGIGGLWVGRAFEKGGASYREPLRSLSHAASARQAARFYVLLDAGQLVSPYWSEYMLSLMAPPEYVHKFVAALRDRPQLEFVARKSGTWRDFHSDSALVQHGMSRYVLVALAEHADGEEWLRRVASIADDIVVHGEHRVWRAQPSLGW